MIDLQATHICWSNQGIPPPPTHVLSSNKKHQREEKAGGWVGEDGGMEMTEMEQNDEDRSERVERC